MDNNQMQGGGPGRPQDRVDKNSRTMVAIRTMGKSKAAAKAFWFFW